MIAEQKKNLKKNKIHTNSFKWLKSFNIANRQPTIIFANECFDFLPIRQFLKKDNDWYEQTIFFNKENRCLQFIDKRISNKTILS